MHVTRVDNSSGFIDLYWPGVLLVEQKGAGRDLEAARVQPGIYFDALPAWDRPRYQLLCNFRAFELLDRDGRAETRFTFADLIQHVEKFGFIIGVQLQTFSATRTQSTSGPRIGRTPKWRTEGVPGYAGDDL